MIGRLRLPLIVTLIVLLMGINGSYPLARGDVGITRVSRSTVVVNQVCGFTIEFQVRVTLYANQGQSISIKLPPGFTVPDRLLAADIKVKDTAPGSVTVTRDPTGTTMTMAVVGTAAGSWSPNILPWEPVSLSIAESAGITNPGVWGIYELEMWTSNEPVHVSEKLTIILGGGNGQSVQGLSVDVSPRAAGRAAEYSLSFSVSSLGEITGVREDYIDVYFPAGTVLPSQPQPGDIIIKGFNCSRVVIADGRVRVWIPESAFVVQGSPCTLIVLQSFGILNPEIPGTYVLQVATSKDTTPSLSREYQIVGTVVSEAIVSADPASQGAPAEYRILLRPSAAGALKRGLDRVYVDFPEGYILPSAVATEKVTINQRIVGDVRVGPGRRVAIYLPADAQAFSSVQVIFAADAGIRNPLSAGTHILKVSTSADTLPLECPLVISSSQVGQVSVRLSSAGTGQRSAYGIEMTLGLGGRLVADVDQIIVRFPSGTQVPATILPLSVSVNKVVCSVVTVSGAVAFVTTPVDVAAGSVANLVFAEGTGIVNPSLPGSYTLSISSTREASLAVSAPYVLADVPTVSATVVPPSPDGLNGYYRTQPTVSFSATSVSDPSPAIYYQVGSSLPIRFFGEPLKIVDGFHAFSFFAIDSQGNRSITRSLPSIAVDTTVPAIALTAPVDGAVVSREALDVTGTVESGCTLTVNGIIAVVGADGTFVATVKLSPGLSSIVLVAEDAAGNESLRELRVTYDATPPTLVVTSPAGETTISRLPLTVTGRAEIGSTVSINGLPAQMALDGSFSGSVDELQDGDNTVVVVARDSAGNGTTKTFVVRYSRSRIIRMQVGNPVALVNGESIPLASPPMVLSGTSYVPLRFIGEAFGASVGWDGIFELVDVELKGTRIRLQVGKTVASVNGQRVALQTPPLLLQGVTMVPVRFVSDALGAQVVWDAATKTISLLYDQGS